MNTREELQKLIVERERLLKTYKLFDEADELVSPQTVKLSVALRLAKKELERGDEEDMKEMCKLLNYRGW